MTHNIQEVKFEIANSFLGIALAHNISSCTLRAFPWKENERTELQTTLTAATDLTQRVIDRMATEEYSDAVVADVYPKQIIQSLRLKQMTPEEKALMQQYFLIKGIQKNPENAEKLDEIHKVYFHNRALLMEKVARSPLTNIVNGLSDWKPTKYFMSWGRLCFLEEVIDGIYQRTPARGTYWNGLSESPLSDEQYNIIGLEWVYHVSLSQATQMILDDFPGLQTKATDITQKVVDLVS